MICVASGGAENCQTCPSGQYAETASSCSAIPGTSLAHTFEAISLDPGGEIEPCQSWTLNNAAELWVNAVEMLNDGAYHHSNWLWAPDTSYTGPDGTWKCSDRGYDELGAVLAGGGVLFAQSTQAKQQVQKFNAGEAVRLPPHTRIIGGTHLLNVTDQAISTSITLTLYTIDRADVVVPLAPFRLTYSDLHLTANADSVVSGQCDVSAVAPGGTPGDLDMDLSYVMPHYHALGRSFALKRFGGSRDGEDIYSIGAFDSEAHGKAFNPPLSMRGSKGFDFQCGYTNPWPQVIQWGIGDVSRDPNAGEMCVMLGFSRASFAFDADVSKGAETAQTGAVHNFTGPCVVAALPFAQGFGDL